MPSQDEFALIRDWNDGRQSEEFLDSAGIVLGIGDDAAVVSGASDREWLFAVDTMVEDVHFRDDTMGEADVGYKALAANVSDIAAMGGVPRQALVSISAPPSWNGERMKRLYDGLYECAERYGIAIIGGDTTSAPRQLVVSVTIIGTVEVGRAIRRNGAKPGQSVFVTGPTGLSAAGLHGLLKQRDRSKETSVEEAIPQRLVLSHRRPAPSVRAGRILLETGWGSSLNDVSDGLASEAWEIAEASQARLVLRERALPVSGDLASYAGAQGVRLLDWMLYGGEDYVLIGTVDRIHELALKERFRAEGLPLFIIGEVESGTPEVVLETASGTRKPLRKGGYNHFPKG
ncbi:thiamine-phosphate kinase [Cohnella endophytica]|uniref:thiamine-phosphate kinase n=1 Tax=Cohnella endophytica TaxID=2419778 RepID=UPI001F2128E8|nr:thiamine-phosphate kinase [Cohnella endophytica]